MGKLALRVFLSLALSLLAALALLVGCSAPDQQQDPEVEENPGPPGGVSEGGQIELPEPEVVNGGPSRGAPPPVWLVAGGEVVQASYGAYCIGDMCMGEEPSRESGDVATAEVPAGEGVLVVVGSDRTVELSAGVVGWDEAPDVSTGGGGVFTKSGIPYFMNVLDARLVPEGEGPVVEPAPGAERDQNTSLTVFELASTGNPGDRQLSVFLDTGDAKPAAYHWRLDPGEEGENPPPEQKEFPGEVVEVESGPETEELSPEETAPQTSLRSVDKIPFGDNPFRIETGEEYLWVLVRDPQGRTLGSETGKAKGKAGQLEVRVLLKVDPETRQVLSIVDEPTFGGALEVGAGAVWLASSDESSVVRVDPETEAVLTTRIGSRLNEIVATEDGIWITVTDDTQSGRVVRLDPETGEIIAEIETPGIAESIAVDKETGDVWAVSLDQTQGRIDYENNQLVRIDPTTNEISERFKVEGGASSVAAAEGGTVWVNTGVGREQAMAKINPQSREIESVVTLDRGSGNRGSPEIEAGSLWMVAPAGPGPPAVTSIEDLGQYETEDLAVGEGAIWVVGAGTPYESGTLTRITPQ
ncbi:MAG: hypothetical protein LC781_17240 [Actinobacteria bacterium]|nr:hypothetical protein [Actinomycetota bacterium]